MSEFHVRTVTAKRVETQKLVSLGDQRISRVATPIVGYVEEGAEPAKVRSSARFVAEAEERIIDAAAAEATRLLWHLGTELAERVQNLLRCSDEQLEVLSELLRGAGLEPADLGIELSAEADAHCVADSGHELAIPTLRVILDTVASLKSPTRIHDADSLFSLVSNRVDMEGWFVRTAGLASLDDAKLVLREASDVILRRWRSGKDVPSYHCDRFLSVNQENQAIVVRPTQPALVGQYLTDAGEGGLAAADKQTSELRLFPTQPTSFFAIDLGTPTLVAVSHGQGEIASVDLSVDRTVRRSQGTIGVVGLDGSAPALRRGQNSTIRSLGGAILAEVDTPDDKSGVSRFDIGDWIASVEQSGHIKRLATFVEVNPVHGE